MDEERILEKVDRLDQYLGEIQADPPDSLAEYEADKRKFERLFQLCIETTVDICAIILKEEGLGTPSDEESIIDKLVEADILSVELGEKVKRMRAFRNVLVHRYGEIDDEKVYRQFERLDDFREFRSEVMGYLDPNET